MDVRLNSLIRLALVGMPLVLARPALAQDCRAPNCDPDRAPAVVPIANSPLLDPQEQARPNAWEQRTPLFDARTVAGIAAMDVSGDSISKAFNGAGSWPCRNNDQEWFNWATSDTHGASLCSAGSEGVFSQAERTECTKGAHITAATPNHARSGDQMLKDFYRQATQIKTWLELQHGPRYVPILLGHNDTCAGNVDKYNSTCSWSGSQNPNNHCRTYGVAYERELRRGLDVLITVPDTHLGLASMVRVSQLCNHGWKINCQSFTPCQSVWTAVAYLGWIFGQANGICGSLTVNCSAQRIADAYWTAKMYRDITARVAAEYSMIPAGGRSRVVWVGGGWVGGAAKAPGVTVAFSDAGWRFRFASSQLNCCDCFHPSPSGQNAASRVLMQGYYCTASQPCCADVSWDSVGSGLCRYLITDGTYIPGLFN